MKEITAKIIVISILLVTPGSVFAQRGCCSRHGGVNYCGSNGYYICNDGTQSPSCTCYFLDNGAESDNDYGIELTDTHCDCNQEDIDELKKDIASLQSDLDSRDEDANLYETLFFITLSIFIGYFVYKNN